MYVYLAQVSPQNQTAFALLTLLSRSPRKLMRRLYLATTMKCTGKEVSLQVIVLLEYLSCKNHSSTAILGRLEAGGEVMLCCGRIQCIVLTKTGLSKVLIMSMLFCCKIRCTKDCCGRLLAKQANAQTANVGENCVSCSTRQTRCRTLERHSSLRLCLVPFSIQYMEGVCNPRYFDTIPNNCRQGKL